MQAKKSNFSKPAPTGQPGTRKGTRAPYTLNFRVGDELVRLTGLFENTSKKGTDYLGVKKIRSEDAARLVEVLSNAAEGAEVGIFVFKSKSEE